MKQHIPKNAYFSRKLRKTDFSPLATAKISFLRFSQKGGILGYMLLHSSYINAAIADILMHEEDLYDLTGQEYRNLGRYETLKF